MSSLWRRNTDCLKQSQRPCSSEDAYTLMAPADTPIVDGGLPSAVTSVQVVGAIEYPDVVSRRWNDRSGRVAGLIYLSRRELASSITFTEAWRSYLYENSIFSKCNPGKSQSESLADHGHDIRVWQRILFFFRKHPAVRGSRVLGTHVRD